MGRLRTEPRFRKDSVTQGVALGMLLVMAGLAVAGPSGFLAWSENLRLLDQRQKELAQLKIDREELKNRVALLDPNNTDPDLAAELVRKNLNVVKDDEVVMLIK